MRRGETPSSTWRDPGLQRPPASQRRAQPAPVIPADVLFPASTAKGRRGPRTPVSTQDGHFRPRPAGLQIPEGRAREPRIPPRFKRLPERSASGQSLEIEQNRSVGEGRTYRRGRGRERLGGLPKRGRPPSPPFRRGLLRARPRRRTTPGPRPPRPDPRPLLEPCPRTPLTSVSGPTAASPSRADAAPSLTASSHKPPARTASGPQDGGRGWGAGEAPSCHGDARQAGEVRLDDNGRIEAELGLAPLPEWALSSVPLHKKGKGS